MFLLYVIIYAFIFIFGAVIGSFLTAWIWRVHQGRSMMEKHSVCPNCDHPLGLLDLLPVISYLALRGKCRYCRAKISPQYLIIEVVTASLFVLATARILGPMVSMLGLGWWEIASIGVSCAVAALLVALFVYDLHWGYLPDIWTLGGSGLIAVATILGLILHQPLLWQPYPLNSAPVDSLMGLWPTLVSGLAAALFFWLIVWGSEKILHKPGMGMGDVKLALLMGLFLGFPGIVVALYLAFILGAVLSLLLLATKQKSFGQTVPFGPFLVVGTLIAWWITPYVINWYQLLL